jgi:hypothetical protein
MSPRAELSKHSTGAITFRDPFTVVRNMQKVVHDSPAAATQRPRQHNAHSFRVTAGAQPNAHEYIAALPDEILVKVWGDLPDLLLRKVSLTRWVQCRFKLIEPSSLEIKLRN